MKEIASIDTTDLEICTGNCQGCGKIHIKIFGEHDAQSQLMSERVHMAMESGGIDGKVLDISDPMAIQANGVRALPALMVEGKLIMQGEVPEVAELTRLMKNKDIFNSKLFQLRTMSVAVDMSDVSANALAFAWKVSQRLGCRLEVVYAMDSIFEGTEPSASGFLSGYTKTMQTELDAFIGTTMASIGVAYLPPSKFAGEPGTPMENDETRFPIVSKVIYGAPDVALSDYSSQSDLLVMGATGRGGLSKQLFGSVSFEVSKSAKCPVLFIPKEAEYRGFDHILYASDFDSLNPLAVQQVVSFAKRFDGHIHFVHVGPGGEPNLDLQRERFRESFEASGYDKPFIFSKMVSEEIVGAMFEYAFYRRIDLLSFVTYKRSFWDNILHKSVTNEALASSSLPILVVHSDAD